MVKSVQHLPAPMAPPPYTDEPPPAGQWPVDPQEDVPLADERIWIDGCFDFSHHGHAGAMLQARRLGTVLLVGTHSDQAILENKGPTVMNLEERCAAVNACRWSTLAVPHAPYVTQLSWITHYGCRFVVHGDDITSDSSGEDCYRYVKQAERFKIVKRTPGISTTDLVGRMLLCTKAHFIKNMNDVLDGKEGNGSEEEKKSAGDELRERIREYASDESGHKALVDVWSWNPNNPGRERRRSSVNNKLPMHHPSAEKGSFTKMVEGRAPLPGQRVVYADGGFDLFTPGHIEFLRQIIITEETEAKGRGWYSQAEVEKRKAAHGVDYSPVYLVAGVHDDEVINHWKGVNYPIMNIFERGLCVLQCKYISSVVFSAPFTTSKHFLQSFPHNIAAVYHGPTISAPEYHDPYADVKSLNLYREIQDHRHKNITASEIVGRILKSRAMYEERQRVKGVKGIGEEAVRRRETMEKEKTDKDKKTRMELKRADTDRQMREIEKSYGA